MVHEDAREIPIDPKEIIADSVAAIDVSHQPLKVIVRDRSLIFLQRFPLRRIGQRSTEVIDCECGRDQEGEEEAEEEAEEEKEGEAEGEAEEEAEAEAEAGGEDPQVKMMRDHGLDFRLFNTMLAGC